MPSCFVPYFHFCTVITSRGQSDYWFVIPILTPPEDLEYRWDDSECEPSCRTWRALIEGKSLIIAVSRSSYLQFTYYITDLSVICIPCLLHSKRAVAEWLEHWPATLRSWVRVPHGTQVWPRESSALLRLSENGQLWWEQNSLHRCVLEQDALPQLLRRSDGALNRGLYWGCLINITRGIHAHSINCHVCWVRRQMTCTQTK